MRRATRAGHRVGMQEVVIRRAARDDEGALATLAVLAESQPLSSDVLLAVVDGELWAATEVETGRTLSDPFRATLPVRELLALRRRSLAA